MLYFLALVVYKIIFDAVLFLVLASVIVWLYNRQTTAKVRYAGYKILVAAVVYLFLLPLVMLAVAGVSRILVSNPSLLGWLHGILSATSKSVLSAGLIILMVRLRDWRWVKIYTLVFITLAIIFDLLFSVRLVSDLAQTSFFDKSYPSEQISDHLLK